jgi:DNA polymerase-3 subunit epsilon
MEEDSKFTNSERRVALIRPLAFLDLETTGKVLGLDRIVEIGVLKVMPEGDQVTFETRLNPEMRISQEATAIHGIGERDVINQPAFKDVAPRLANFLHGCDLAGYNILSFDLPMLSSEFRRVHIPFQVEGREIVDALAIFVQKEPRDLKTAYRFYCGREYENAHSAAADARACWEVLQGQVDRYADLPNTPNGLSTFITENRRKRTLDSGGWFEMRDGEPAFARGRHQGLPICEVAKIAPEYLEWMLATGLPNDTIKLLRSILPDFAK